MKKRRMRCGVSCGERACRPIRPHELIKRTLFSFHLFFLNAVCWWLGWQGSGRHIKALSLKSSKLVVNSAWNPACMPVNQGFFEIINHFLQKSQQIPPMYQKSADGVLMGEAFFEKNMPKTAVKLRNRQHFNKSVKRSQNQLKSAESAIVPKTSTFVRNVSEISRFSQKAK